MQCIGIFDMGSAVGCLISEGAWVFVGIENAVKVSYCNNVFDYSFLTIAVN